MKSFARTTAVLFPLGLLARGDGPTDAPHAASEA
jgi:hypothetical protein